MDILCVLAFFSTSNFREHALKRTISYSMRHMDGSSKHIGWQNTVRGRSRNLKAMWSTVLATEGS